MRFDDDKYVKNYVKYGEFPKIHDDIYYLDKYVKGLPVIDIGSCKGLLSVRLAVSHDVVIGIEANTSYYLKSIEHRKVKYFNVKVDFDTLDGVKGLINDYGIRCVYARRVLPELYDTGGLELIKALSKMLHDSGVQYIVLEGRKATKNAKNKLYDVDQEIASLKDHYNCIRRHKNCALLEAR